jgi:hypothetical protein
VLRDCTALTALDLQDCQLRPEQRSGLAAIAALPELQQLRLHREQHNFFADNIQVFPAFQHPLKITHLSLSIQKDVQQLSRLSALVNLQHLDLALVPGTGYPGGWPSQLVHLTYLHLEYDIVSDAECDAREQFQHLSCLTALQDLEGSCVISHQRHSRASLVHSTSHSLQA